VYEVRRERTGLEDLFARLTQHEETGPHSLSEVDDVTR
jgi:hypothetical protein